MAKKCAECGEKLKLTNRRWQYINGVFTEFCSDEHRAAYEGRAALEARSKPQPPAVEERPVVKEELSRKERIRTFYQGLKTPKKGFKALALLGVMLYVVFVLTLGIEIEDGTGRFLGFMGMSGLLAMVLGGAGTVIVICYEKWLASPRIRPLKGAGQLIFALMLGLFAIAMVLGVLTFLSDIGLLLLGSQLIGNLIFGMEGVQALGVWIIAILLFGIGFAGFLFTRKLWVEYDKVVGKEDGSVKRYVLPIVVLWPIWALILATLSFG